MSEESKKVNILRGQIEPQVVVKNVFVVTAASRRDSQQELLKQKRDL